MPKSKLDSFKRRRDAVRMAQEGRSTSGALPVPTGSSAVGEVVQMDAMGLDATFDAMDTDRDGLISRAEFKAACGEARVRTLAAATKKILEQAMARTATESQQERHRLQATGEGRGRLGGAADRKYPGGGVRLPCLALVVAVLKQTKARACCPCCAHCYVPEPCL